jgi:multidrug efflux system membrane fusion protein
MSSDANLSSPKTKRHWAAWIVALGVLLGGGYLLSQRASGDQTPPKSSGKKSGKGFGGPIPVTAEKVKQGDMGVYISALGAVTPVYTVSITSRVAGQLVQVAYREGQLVHKGDLLAVIDPRPYQAVYDQTQGQLQRDQALLKNARTDLERYKAAFAQHAIPEQTLVTQESTVSQYEGTTRLDQGSVDAAKVNVDYTKITSPIDGRVGLRQVDPGNIVQANGTTPLLTITQLQPTTVVFTMAEDFISDVVTQLRAGHKLQVDAFDRDNRTLLAQGTVLTLDNQIDATTGTVKIRAQFANRDLRLFPNEFVNARLLVRTLKDADIVPTAALQRSNDTSFVYVVDPQAGTVKTRSVVVAATNGLDAAITGVQPGDELVTDGFDKLQNNTKVVVRQPRPAQTDSVPEQPRHKK